MPIIFHTLEGRLENIYRAQSVRELVAIVADFQENFLAVVLCLMFVYVFV